MTYILPILSGILTAVSFSSPYLSYIVFIALIPVFLCNDAKKVSRNIALFSFSYHCILMIWLYRLGSAWSPIIITILIILIAIIMSFVYWLPFFILKPKSVISYLCTFLLAEFATTLFGSLSFPWGRLGTILGSHSSLIQMASITGTFGLTLFILSINMLFVIAIKQRKFFYCFLAFLCFFLNILYGTIVLSFKETPADPYPVAALQSGIGSTGKWMMTLEETMLEYLELTEMAIENDAKLIVYPETAIPFYYSNEMKNFYQYYINQRDCEILIACYYYDGEFEYNTVINPKNDTRYDKQMLVPMGEFIPLAKLIGATNTLRAGSISNTVQTNVGDVGMLICYDSIFSNLMRNSVKNGAKLLIVSSNDSWFEQTPALYQHHCHAMLRAVESRRYLLRSASTGYTSIINPYGQVEASVLPYEKNILIGNVANSEKLTFYTIFGDWIIVLAFLYIIIEKLYKHKKIA